MTQRPGDPSPPRRYSGGTTDDIWVRTDKAVPVRHVVLTAPAGPNRISLECARQLEEAVVAAASDPAARVIIISGEGAAWNVGGDLGQMRDAGAGIKALIEAIGESVNRLAETVHTCDKITVAAVHGAVAGGALGLMSACDLVVAADGTVFTQGYARLGTNPDAGTTWFLPRIIGYRRALQMYLTSEQLRAEEAFQLGLVTHVVPAASLTACVDALAAKIAGLSQPALSETKRLFRTSFANPLREHLAAEIHQFAVTSTTTAFAEGVAAFFERRDPIFE